MGASCTRCFILVQGCFTEFKHQNNLPRDMVGFPSLMLDNLIKSLKRLAQTNFQKSNLGYSVTLRFALNKPRTGQWSSRGTTRSQGNKWWRTVRSSFCNWGLCHVFQSTDKAMHHHWQLDKRTPAHHPLFNSLVQLVISCTASERLLHSYTYSWTSL